MSESKETDVPALLIGAWIAVSIECQGKQIWNGSRGASWNFNVDGTIDFAFYQNGAWVKHLARYRFTRNEGFGLMLLDDVQMWAIHHCNQHELQVQHADQIYRCTRITKK